MADFVLNFQANALLTKEDQNNFFPCTLKGVAMDYFIQFELKYFTSWEYHEDEVFG